MPPLGHRFTGAASAPANDGRGWQFRRSLSSPSMPPFIMMAQPYRRRFRHQEWCINRRIMLSRQNYRKRAATIQAWAKKSKFIISPSSPKRGRHYFAVSIPPPAMPHQHIGLLRPGLDSAPRLDFLHYKTQWAPIMPLEFRHGSLISINDVCVGADVFKLGKSGFQLDLLADFDMKLYIVTSHLKSYRIYR